MSQSFVIHGYHVCVLYWVVVLHHNYGKSRMDHWRMWLQQLMRKGVLSFHTENVPSRETLVTSFLRASVYAYASIVRKCSKHAQSENVRRSFHKWLCEVTVVRGDDPEVRSDHWFESSNQKESRRWSALSAFRDDREKDIRFRKRFNSISARTMHHACRSTNS